MGERLSRAVCEEKSWSNEETKGKSEGEGCRAVHGHCQSGNLSSGRTLDNGRNEETTAP